MTKTSENRERIAAALLADPRQTDRQVATATGTSHRTVASERKKMEGSGQIPQQETRVGALGKIFKRKPRKANPSITAPEPNTPSIIQRAMNAVLGREQQPPRIECPACGCAHYVDVSVGNRPARVCRHCGRRRPSEQRSRR